MKRAREGEKERYNCNGFQVAFEPLGSHTTALGKPRQDGTSSALLYLMLYIDGGRLRSVCVLHLDESKRS